MITKIGYAVLMPVVANPQVTNDQAMDLFRRAAADYDALPIQETQQHSLEQRRQALNGFLASHGKNLGLADYHGISPVFYALRKSEFSEQ